MTGNTETILRLQNTFRIADNTLGICQPQPRIARYTPRWIFSGLPLTQDLSAQGGRIEEAFRPAHARKRYPGYWCNSAFGHALVSRQSRGPYPVRR